MFQNPGPQQDPCGNPLFIYLSLSLCLSSRTLLVVRIAVGWLKWLFVMLYRFLGQPQAHSPFSILGHQTASNAPLTSRLASTMTSPAARLSMTKFFISTVASMVPFWGVNPC